MRHSTTYTILCVDDNPANLQLLDRTLFEEGYIVLIAKSGKQALEIAQEKLPDLILLDIAMPDLDGFEVLQELRAIPETSEIPVVFVTALTDSEEVVRGLVMGAVDYVTKPVNFREFLPKIANLLQLKAEKDILSEKRSEAEKFMKVQTKLYASTLDELTDRLKKNDTLLKNLVAQEEKVDKKADLEKIKSNNFYVCNKLEKLEMRSKIINNTVETQMQSFDVDPLVKVCVEHYTPQAQSKAVTLIYETPGVHRLWADKALFRIVLMNLLSNAVKYTPHGGDIIVDVKDYEEDPDNYMLINVYDTGTGLTTAQSETIFDDKNFLGDETGKNGLGLGIAYHFVKLMGGKIWVESMPGIGSDFKFTLLKHK
ncbi:MAG: hybrid sensor histidine kinase/response regulator [Bacteroidales bacterium]|nr:hybrid sensor histidine kinase/response regulator [Bacteroidales bacterium]